MVVRGPADPEVAAPQVQDHLTPSPSGGRGGHRCGAGSGAAGQGLSCAPFPHPHVDLAWIDHLGKFDIGAVGPHRVTFEMWAQTVEIKVRNGGDKYHSMGIAHRDGCHLIAAPGGLDLTVNHF